MAKRKSCRRASGKKLDPAEIAAIKAWIDAGAHGPPAGTVASQGIGRAQDRAQGRSRACRSWRWLMLPTLKLIAVGSYGEVELRSSESPSVTRTLNGHHGNVNAVVFSPDGAICSPLPASPALSGEVRQWKVADGTLVRTFAGHKDALYAAALSPDGKTLATGSYDQKIKLWNVETGKEIKTLSGHNGAVFSLAFRPDGKILASASADRTVKLVGRGFR